QEATAAIRACKAVTDLPVMATMFFQFEDLHDRDRTMWGESPAEVAKNLLAAGADVVGMNCGRGPDRAIVIIREMRQVTDAPLGAQVLADLPLAIDPDEVLRFQGYKKGVDAPTPDVRALFDDALAEGTRLMLPRAVVRWLPVEARGPDTLEAGGEVLTIPLTG